MECACFDPTNDDCFGGYYEATKPKARRMHICDECWGAILPGEVYENEAFFDGGSVERFKTCKCCMEIRTKFLCSWYHCDVWNHLAELFDGCIFHDDLPLRSIGELSSPAKYRVIDFIERRLEEFKSEGFYYANDMAIS